jgi:hypothetical protein
VEVQARIGYSSGLEAFKMARKKKNLGHYVESNMFGENHVIVLQKRETLKTRGGAKKGDEAVILTYRRNAAGKRSDGEIASIPADDLPAKIKGMKEI